MDYHHSRKKVRCHVSKSDNVIQTASQGKLEQDFAQLQSHRNLLVGFLKKNK